MGDLTESDLLAGFGGDGVQGKIERKGKRRKGKSEGKRKGEEKEVKGKI